MNTDALIFAAQVGFVVGFAVTLYFVRERLRRRTEDRRHGRRP